MPNVPLSQVLTEEVYANSWADIIAYYTWDAVWVRNLTPNVTFPHSMKRALVKHPAPKAWAKLMAAAKKNMTEVVRTDVTEIK
jgi:hypothetical protein